MRGDATGSAAPHLARRTARPSTAPRRSASTRRATRIAWPSAATSCGSARRRRRARSCATCTPRSTRSASPPGDVCLAELDDLGQLALRARVRLSPTGSAAATPAKAPAGPFRRVHAGAVRRPGDDLLSLVPLDRRPERRRRRDRQRLPRRATASAPASGDARNPPALVALGVVQALAREMSRDLQQQRADLVRDAARAGAARESAAHRQGRRLRRAARDGEGRARRVGRPRRRCRPGRQAVRLEGHARRLRRLRGEALQVHIGIQSDALLATGSREHARRRRAIPPDPDGDGVRDELGRWPVRGDDRAPGAARAADRRAADPGPRSSPPAAKALLPPTTTSFADDFAARPRAVPRRSAAPAATCR